MDEYISRETLLKAVEKMDRLDKETKTKYEYDKEGYILLIQNAPASDVVEVVRCENCTRRVDYKGRIMCNKFGHKFQGEWYGLHATTKDHFCSYGERKGEDDVKRNA